MTGKEKLYFLLDKIEDARVITPSGQPVKLHPYNNLDGKYSEVELTQLFAKLENDEHILRVIKTPGIQTIQVVDYFGDDPYDYGELLWMNMINFIRNSEPRLRIQTKSS